MKVRAMRSDWLNKEEASLAMRSMALEARLQESSDAGCYSAEPLVKMYGHRRRP